MNGYRYIVGQSYATQGGRRVRVVERAANLRGYETVLGDDGKHRYDRSTTSVDAGRVTGTNHENKDPDNFVRLSDAQVLRTRAVLRTVKENNADE